MLSNGLVGCSPLGELMDDHSLDDFYFHTIGLIVQQASIAESMLCQTLEALTNLETSTAEAVFYTFDALPTRKNLLRRVLVAINASSQVVDQVDQIIHYAELVNNKRMELAHSTLMYNSEFDGPVQLRAKLQNKQHKPITRAYVTSVIAESAKATEQCIIAYQGLMALLRAQQQ